MVAASVHRLVSGPGAIRTPAGQIASSDKNGRLSNSETRITSGGREARFRASVPEITDSELDWPGSQRVFQRVGAHVTAGDGPTDFDIDEFTREVDISPTFQRKKNIGKRSPFTTWVYELEEREEVMTEILVKELLDKPDGRGSRWIEAMTSQKLTTDVRRRNDLY